MLASTTAVLRGLTLRYNKSCIRYIFFEEPFVAFLEGQMPEDKPTSLLAIKNLLFYLVIFLTHNHLSLHNIYSLQV